MYAPTDPSTVSNKPDALGLNLRAMLHLTRTPDGVSGHRFKEMKIQMRDDDWLLIIKKDSPKGPKVAFFRGTTFDGVIWMMAAAVKEKRVPWKDDKFAGK